ncbi:MAG: C1 family peptidase [Cyclobacteriaceae bacterium]|nr:C1 family peptidase [Cyclobacteriaceae bacterium]MDH4298450.1 C1 family peptidase [Cyclobacteriaceae bacterium]MDH5247795.1 C1 family peptidase [Cyclobacteriaceae bacterium]
MVSSIKILSVFFIGILFYTACLAQPNGQNNELTLIKSSVYTPVKNQANSGTCWSFSVTSLIESQTMKNGLGALDLSEMFTVRSIYMDKARNYILRQGAAQFGPGGLGHDVLYAMENYGAVPESVYSGLLLGQKLHNHTKMDSRLKLYLDSLLNLRPIPGDWMTGFRTILDNYLGKPPDVFLFQEKQYTPKTFASEVLHFSAKDYVTITSFTHHPFYTSFALEVPDNFLNGNYFNLPLDEMIKLTEQALQRGYSLMWDADVSNELFRQQDGFAMLWRDGSFLDKGCNPDDEEQLYDQATRQALYENLTTQDDHLMHLVGLKRSAGGKKFFLVKNSWGNVGPFEGLINVSEAYFAVNTISLVLPRAALDQEQLSKLRLSE